MHIVILLWVFIQSFPTNIRYSGVQAALIGAVMRTYFKIEKLPMCSRRTTLIPNHNICGGSRRKVAYPYYIPKIVHSHGYLINMACVLGIEKDIRQISTHRAYGHAAVKCVTKYGKWELWLYGESLSTHHISSTTEFNKVRTRETFRIYTSSEQSERD